MLKCAYDEELWSRTSVFECHKRYIEAQKMRMQKSRVKTMLTAFFLCWRHYSPWICVGKMTLNCKFYKEVIKRLFARIHRVRPEFQESGSRYLLHDNAPAYSSPSSWQNEGSPCYPIHPAPLILHRFAFLISKLKNAKKWTRFEAVSSIQQIVTRELKIIREEAFPRAFIRCMSEVNVCGSGRALYVVSYGLSPGT
jgi:hypothetical protein